MKALQTRKTLTPRAPALLGATLAALLAGCAVGPDYQRPSTLLPNTYNVAAGAQASAPGSNPAAVDPEWWKRFQDPALNSLVDMAFAHNTDVAAAVARVEEAQAVSNLARAAFIPEVDLNGSGSRTRASTVTATPMPSGTPTIRDARSASLSTSFELDFWGHLRRADEAARNQLLASRFGQDTVKLTLASQVATNYLLLRSYDAQIVAVEDSLKTREDTLKLVKSQEKGGYASPMDRLQAEANLAASKAALATLRQQRGVTENQIALLAGTPGLELLPGKLETVPMPPVPPVGLPAALLESRPDIRQAEESLAAATAQIGVVKAAYFPTFTLTSSLGSDAKNVSNLFSAAAGTWSLGLGLAMPLFDAGRTAARVEQATAQQKQSIAAYQNTIQTAFKEVKDALVTLREAEIGDLAATEQATAAKAAAEIARKRYAAGYASFLTLLDAQRTANDAVVAQVKARQIRLSAAVDLFKALGGGWQDPSPRTPQNTPAEHLAAAPAEAGH